MVLLNGGTVPGGCVVYSPATIDYVLMFTKYIGAEGRLQLGSLHPCAAHLITVGHVKVATNNKFPQTKKMGIVNGNQGEQVHILQPHFTTMVVVSYCMPHPLLRLQTLEIQCENRTFGPPSLC